MKKNATSAGLIIVALVMCLVVGCGPTEPWQYRVADSFTADDGVVCNPVYWRWQKEGEAPAQVRLKYYDKGKRRIISHGFDYDDAWILTKSTNEWHQRVGRLVFKGLGVKGSK